MNYTALHAVVRGASHERKGIPCEDYAGTFTSSEPSYRVVVVADGHGDPTCVRSAIGSRLATDVALRCLGEFAAHAIAEAERHDDALVEMLGTTEGGLAISRLTDAMVYEWSSAVQDDLATSPLTEDELAVLGENGAAWAAEHVEHLYGSTLVAALALPGALLLVQLGDGCSAVVYEDGEISDPIPVDELCVGNVTTSLSDPNASDEVRYALVDLRNRAVVACYVASDGIEKSLSPDGGVPDFFGRMTVELPEHIAQGDTLGYLEETLSELSRLGSNDDASVALVIDVNMVDVVADELQRRHERFALLSRLQWARRKHVSMQRKRDYLLEQPATEGGLGERERYLAEFDELTLYLNELEERYAELVAGDLQAEPAEVPAESGVTQAGEDATAAQGFATESPDRTVSMKVLGEGEGVAFAERPQGAYRTSAGRRNAGRLPLWSIIVAAAIGITALVGGIALVRHTVRLKPEKPSVEVTNPEIERPSTDAPSPEVKGALLKDVTAQVVAKRDEIELKELRARMRDLKAEKDKWHPEESWEDDGEGEGFDYDYVPPEGYGEPDGSSD